jgi:hypothetical protein
VTHLLPVVLMDETASAPAARRRNAGPCLRPDGMRSAMITLRYGLAR